MTSHRCDIGVELAKAWNGGPRLFEGILDSPIFEATDFHRALQATTSAMATGIAEPSGRWGINGREASPSEVQSFLPDNRSESFETYESRLRSTFPGDEFHIIIDGIDSASPALRDKLTPLLHSLFSRVGYPVRGIHSCIYAGNYRSTPFGVHVDDCHVVMACGIGRKRMAFWPTEYFADRSDLLAPAAGNMLIVDAREHLEHATILEIGPHDILYWPAGVWHTALSDNDAFHAALSVGIYHRGSSTNLVRQTIPLPRRVPMNTGLNAFAAMDMNGFSLGPSASALDLVPALYMQAWCDVRDQVMQEAAAVRFFLQKMFSMVSSAGFGTPPASVIDEQANMVRCPHPPALTWQRLHNGTLLVAFNGSTVILVEAGPSLEAALGELKNGSALPIATLEELSGSWQAAKVKGFLLESGHCFRSSLMEAST